MFSSLIRVLTRHLADAAAPGPPTGPFQLAALAVGFDCLPDPRRVRGRRYRLSPLLGLCLVGCSVAHGHWRRSPASRPARGACTAFSTGPLWCADCMSGWLDRLQTAAAAGATAAAVSP
ncbi:hypothetical protein SALBM135S_05625 [Streptomyces alboniger]